MIRNKTEQEKFSCNKQLSQVSPMFNYLYTSSPTWSFRRHRGFTKFHIVLIHVKLGEPCWKLQASHEETMNQTLMYRWNLWRHFADLFYFYLPIQEQEKAEIFHPKDRHLFKKHQGFYLQNNRKKFSTMLTFRIPFPYLCINQQYKNMKYQAVHDKKSETTVAFLGKYSLICESEEKKQDNVSDDILQNLQTELLGLVKSGKFKRKASTIIWSKHVLYSKRAWTASTEFRLQGFSRT